MEGRGTQSATRKRSRYLNEDGHSDAIDSIILETEESEFDVDSLVIIKSANGTSLDHPKRMMEKLYQSKETMDVVIRGNDGNVRAHASILMAGSPFFEAALKGMKHFSDPAASSSASRMEESTTGIIDFSNDHSSLSIRILVKFIYLGDSYRPKDSQDGQIADLISLCKQIGGLADYLLHALVQQLCSACQKSSDCCIPFYLLARKYDLAALEDSASKSLLQDFGTIFRSKPEILSWLSLEEFSAFVRSDDLQCKEIIVFKAVMHYIRPLVVAERWRAKATLVPLVRYDLMSPAELEEVEKEPLLATEFVQNLFRRVALQKFERSKTRLSLPGCDHLFFLSPFQTSSGILTLLSMNHWIILA